MAAPGGRALASTIRRDASPYGVSGIVATVFGATGFMGQYVVDLLGRVGSQTVVPYRGDGMNARALKLAGNVGQVVPLPYDLKNKDSIRRSMSRSNVVINLIGKRYETKNFNYHDTNVKIPYRLAEVAKEMGVERFIHISANGAAPDSTSEFFRTKYEGEEAVKSFFPDATILRPTNMYGRQDTFIRRYADMFAAVPYIPVVNGHQQIQPVFVHDVANAVFNSITFSEAMGQTYELGGDRRYTMNELLELIKQESRRTTRTLVPVPAPVASVIAQVCDNLPPQWKFVTPDEIKQMQVDNIVLPGALGFEHLGIKPQSLEENIVNGILVMARGQTEENEVGMRTAEQLNNRDMGGM